VDGESHVLHTEEEALGTRLVMDTLSCLIAKEADPSRLNAVSPGKLVRYLVANGDHVEHNQAYAELEVMKMVMPVLAPAAGVITFLIPEGSSLSAGDQMARLELDDPTKVKRAELFTGLLPELGPPQVYCDRVDYRFTQALNACKMIMAGGLRSGSRAGPPGWPAVAAGLSCCRLCMLAASTALLMPISLSLSVAFNTPRNTRAQSTCRQFTHCRCKHRHCTTCLLPPPHRAFFCASCAAAFPP
jgi:hypothetical protein